MYSLILLLITNFNCSDIEKIDLEFENIKTGNEKHKFIAKYENSSCNEAKTYTLALKASEAEEAFWPHKKYQIYKTNYSTLSNLINEQPDNIRMRYARFLISQRVPGFLRNDMDFMEDKVFIITALEKAETPGYLKSLIKKNTSL